MSMIVPYGARSSLITLYVFLYLPIQLYGVYKYGTTEFVITSFFFEKDTDFGTFVSNLLSLYNTGKSASYPQYTSHGCKIHEI